MPRCPSQCPDTPAVAARCNSPRVDGVDGTDEYFSHSLMNVNMNKIRNPSKARTVRY